MRCFTATVDKQQPSVESGITRQYLVNNNGIFTAVGSMFALPASVRHLRRQRDWLKIEPALLHDVNCFNDPSAKRVVLWRCNWEYQGKTSVLKPEATQPDEFDNQTDNALVLLRVRADHLPDASLDEQVGQGIGIGVDSNSTYWQHERLLMLERGQTVQVTFQNSVPRIMGLAVHGGQETIVELSFDGEKVSAREVSTTPLGEPLYSLNHRSAWRDPLYVLLAGLIGALLGSIFLSDAPSVFSMSGSLIGGIGLTLFFLLTLVLSVRDCYRARPDYTGKR